ncbi:MAG: type II toxin-antitoxin system VapC family toxin [Myxococcota bacterium]|nr:type II toxin-antitoxin system VapC family toxin [Myxococcota bacterium]
MSLLLLDTNVVSYLLKAHPLAERYLPLIDGHTLAISFMTVGEMYEGAFRAGWSERRLALLDACLSAYHVVPGSTALCRTWAKVRADRRAHPIAVDDAWIAACALFLGCPLVTHNVGDFRDIDGLELISG